MKANGFRRHLSPFAAAAAHFRRLQPVSAASHRLRGFSERFISPQRLVSDCRLSLQPWQVVGPSAFALHSNSLVQSAY